MSASNELKALKKDIQDIVAVLSSDSSTVEWLGRGLVSKKLLSEEVVEHVINGKGDNLEKVRLLVRTLEEQVEADSAKFHVFIELLKETKLCRTLVAKLLNSLGKYACASMDHMRCIESNITV